MRDVFIWTLDTMNERLKTQVSITFERMRAWTRGSDVEEEEWLK